MLVFIDESGIHKPVDNSTFVLAYIQLQNYGAVEKTICILERKLGIDYFHWSETTWPVKQKFLEEMVKLDFKAKIAVVKNPVNPTEEVERLLAHMLIERNIKNIYIDGKKPKWYEHRVKKILRDKMIPIRKLKTVNSRQYAGIRLADLIAGLSRWHFDNKNAEKAGKYFQKLKEKIIVIIE